MAKNKLQSYRVKLSATLSATASIIVEAKNAEDAEEIALRDYMKADWKGSDVGDYPQGCDVEVYGVSLS